jgi:putative transposase
MDQHRREFRLRSMCRVLKVHRSGYYAWKACPTSDRAVADEALLIDIKQSFEDSWGRLRKRILKYAKPIAAA